MHLRVSVVYIHAGSALPTAGRPGHGDKAAGHRDGEAVKVSSGIGTDGPTAGDAAEEERPHPDRQGLSVWRVW